MVAVHAQELALEQIHERQRQTLRIERGEDVEGVTDVRRFDLQDHQIHELVVEVRDRLHVREGVLVLQRVEDVAVALHEHTVPLDMWVFRFAFVARVDAADEFLIDRRVVTEQLQTWVRRIVVHDQAARDTGAHLYRASPILPGYSVVVPALDANLPERQQKQGQRRETLLSVDDLVGRAGWIVLLLLRGDQDVADVITVVLCADVLEQLIDLLVLP